MNKTYNYKKVLKDTFGYDEFRGLQCDIIDSISQGKDTVVVMQTGGGKSMCFQLPALVKSGIAIVISPLISLMKNQVDNLLKINISAAFFNSTLNKKATEEVKNKVLNGEIKLLYVAPESLKKDTTIEFLKQSNLSFVAVDEAHCISEWGHDFRPEYRNIKTILEDIQQKVPIIALTATATPIIQKDIVTNLKMKDVNIFRSTFNRKNLFYEIKPKKQIKQQLINLLKSNENQSVIVYCLSRKKVEEIAEFLQINKINAIPYHAGIEPSKRKLNQELFLSEKVDVVVATIAFGMGIDKPNVRLVVHYDVPKSMEGYYQETGRAGRDGKPAKCVLFYSPKDIDKLGKYSKDKTITERENSQILLEDIAAYSESSLCRRKLILSHFGEDYDIEKSKHPNCCDNCLKSHDIRQGKELYIIALNALLETSERCTIRHIKDVLLGNVTSNVIDFKHEKLKCFGQGKEIMNRCFPDNNPELIWIEGFRQAIILGLLKKNLKGISVPSISKEGKKFYENPYDIPFIVPVEYVNLGKEEEMDNVKNKQCHVDELLYDILEKYREKKAKEQGIPRYVVFPNVSLDEIATLYPNCNDELLQITGFGMGKVKKYGKDLIQIINKHLDENDSIDKTKSFVVISKGNKSRKKLEIIKQIDFKVDLENIAENLEIEFSDLLTEMKMIAMAGTKINIDYYIDSVLDEESKLDLKEYFLEIDDYNINDAMEELGEYYTRDEIEMMHIHFLNEYAN